jgi:hypothetical protein
VIKAIKTGLEIFKSNQSVLLAETQPQTPEIIDTPGTQKATPNTKATPDINAVPNATGTSPGEPQSGTEKSVTDGGKTSG